MLAKDFYLHCMSQKHGSLPRAASADLTRMRRCFEWFNAMATPLERVQLLDKKSNLSELHTLVDELETLVLQRIKQAYVDANLQVLPPTRVTV